MEIFFITLLGTLTSCLIELYIFSQFIEERYQRIYESKRFYLGIKIIAWIAMSLINLLNNAYLNMLCWFFIIFFISFKFYYSKTKKTLLTVIELLVFILLLGGGETIGVVLFNILLPYLNISRLNPVLLSSLNMLFSKIIVLFFYCILIIRLWKKNKQASTSIVQYINDIVISLYSLINLVVIFYVSNNSIHSQNTILLILNMVCVVLVDLYYLYFIKYSVENNQLKFQLQLMEQQSVLKYEYYTAQERKYLETLSTIRDVNEYIKTIQNICKEQSNTKILECTDEIVKLLDPITPKKYISNSLLNILLDDKKKDANLSNIDLNIDIGEVDLEFMEPIEITTLFGNLLDNAIEACEKVHAERSINMKLRSYHNFVVLDISNSSYYVKSDSTGNPVSKKDSFPHGIGLTNVRKIIDKYNGDLKLDWSKGRFNCSVIFNS